VKRAAHLTRVQYARRSGVTHATTHMTLLNVPLIECIMCDSGRLRVAPARVSAP